jgi:hypothetical protein
MELATEKYLSGDFTGLLGQFASTKGYSDLIAAATHDPILMKFFHDGATENTIVVRSRLMQLAIHAQPDVAHTARGLAQMMQGQHFVMVTQGMGCDQ